MIEILNLENIKIKSLNDKFGYSPAYGKLYMSKEYKEFKELLVQCMCKTQIQPPYRVIIETEMYIDIDNPIKVIIDAMQTAGVIEDDRHIIKLDVYKKQVKRNAENKLRILVEGSYDQAM
jgi:Holliday junction resolvase RusA-like endonuclease